MSAHVPQSPDEALDPLRRMAFHWREAETALGLPHDADRQQALFRALKIETGDLRKRPWGWSRGMQQRFVIAMALIGAPNLLVMDEPTSALDPIVAARTMVLLEDYLAARDTALVLITHDLGLAAGRVTRLLVMNAGRIIEDRPTSELLAAPRTTQAGVPLRPSQLAGTTMLRLSDVNVKFGKTPVLRDVSMTPACWTDARRCRGKWRWKIHADCHDFGFDQTGQRPDHMGRMSRSKPAARRW